MNKCEITKCPKHGLICKGDCRQMTDEFYDQKTIVKNSKVYLITRKPAQP